MVLYTYLLRFARIRERKQKQTHRRSRIFGKSNGHSTPTSYACGLEFAVPLVPFLSRTARTVGKPKLVRTKVQVLQGVIAGPTCTSTAQDDVLNVRWLADWLDGPLVVVSTRSCRPPEDGANGKHNHVQQPNADVRTCE